MSFSQHGGIGLDRPQSLFYFVPQRSHSQAGLALSSWSCRPEVPQSIFLSSLSLPPCVFLSFIFPSFDKEVAGLKHQRRVTMAREKGGSRPCNNTVSLSRLRISDSVKSAFVAALNLQMTAKNTAWHIFLTIHVNDVLWIMVSFFTTVQYSASLLSF